MNSSVPPTVSVISIAFKDLEGLRRTINSTAAQTYPAIEHIVIDGGSGAETVEFLENAKLDYWQSCADGGRYDAMNQGIDRASGDLLWFMHAGDSFADRHAISAAVDALDPQRHARDQWGHGAARLVGDDARSGMIWCYIPFDMRRFASGTQPIPHQAAFFGADVVAEAGHYSTNFGLAADHLFMLRAAQVTPPVVTARVLCDFDTSGAGSVRPQHEHYHDIRRSWDETGYYPSRSRLRSRVYSRGIEWNARVRAAARGVVARNRAAVPR